MMDFAKMVRINNFIEMLHRGECMIDSKANDISYDNVKTLADFITYSNKLSIPDSSTLNLAYRKPIGINEFIKQINSILQ